MIANVIGFSNLGLPIEVYEFNGSYKTQLPHVLLLGGVHGDEIEGTTVALGLLAHWEQKGFHFPAVVSLIPRFNIDGVILKTRNNFNGVDLNRNLPTRDWTKNYDHPRYYPGPQPLSEPENQALINYLEIFKPHLIISLHSWYPLINVNGDCIKYAQVLQKHTGYRIEQDIGYPTPGSLGTYAGLERKMPTITYEIERGAPLPQCLSLHIPAICEVLKIISI